MSGRALMFSAIGAVMLTGCQSLGAPVPAVLTSGDAETMAKVKTALAAAMGQAHVELGPGDPTRSSILSVLPRPPGPPEDRSLAMPTIFRLEMEAGACFVVREDGGARAKIEGVACRPA